MAKYDAGIVLGGGIVGISTAIHLAKRGLSVALVDRRAPGEETSFGNAGIIQREGVHPYMFPRDLRAILDVALKRRTDADYHLSSLPRSRRSSCAIFGVEPGPRAGPSRRTCRSSRAA
jgi:D-amino-acid dehydrogenase